MAARIREGGSGGPSWSGSNGILAVLGQGVSTSNAIVPYQGPQGRNYGGNGESLNDGGSFNNGGGYNRGSYNNNGQRYSRPWTGGNKDWDREYDRDEREQRTRENAKLLVLEEEKKKLQAEEEKRVQATKDREQQEARLGRIVRTSVKAVCESALGRKVDIPEDDDNEVAKLRKELEELRAKSQDNSSESHLEALRKEKDALLKRNQESDEERLRKEIAELKSRKEQDKPACEGKDVIMVLQLQIKELGVFRSALKEKNAEVSALKSENKHLRKDVSELREEFVNIKGKWAVEEVTGNSPLEEPARGKQRADPSPTAMYTPKDLEALQKAYKAALQSKEMALKEAKMLKERMTRMGASRIRISTHRTTARKTMPRNLRTSFQAVDVGSDDDRGDKGGDNRKARTSVDVAHNLKVAKMAGFCETRLKEIRQAKKADMETACVDEGITYIKLDQAKADVAEIRASCDYADSIWLKEREKGQDDDQDQHYATSTEEVGEE
ncbi:hypothetical protein CBR_g828 [Chara braunii]|uniref:Uncharacterized protein n=1 Tax=Chara braunii TaxID=69332 RepID=A0A388KCC2_CHABU|nr:hypothetical protein CBR_g828 [Chara braunii]|eukprot:GBG67700.1 hypothetical protein CBR_g828 [Chara braunii]